MKLTRMQQLMLSLFLAAFSVPALATGTGDSIDVYQNHTVTTTVYVYGRDTIGVSNVEVDEPGKLYMAAPRGFTVTSGLYVMSGARLELHTDSQWPVSYTYDASGNTTERRRQR